MTPITSYDLQSIANDAALFGILFIIMCLVIIVRKGYIRLKWFALSLLAFAFNTFSLTLGRWFARPLTQDLQWNWSGKMLALFLTIIMIGFLSRTLRGQIGLNIKQAKGSMNVWIGIGIYTAIFLIIAWFSPPPQTKAYWESLAFQLTMPSLDEELFYRGLFPMMLDRCFKISRNIIGAPIGWGALISSIMFGLVHGVSLNEGSLSIDWMACAIPGFIGLLGCWIAQKTKSLLGPILMHSHGNAINYII